MMMWRWKPNSHHGQSIINAIFTFRIFFNLKQKNETKRKKFTTPLLLNIIQLNEPKQNTHTHTQTSMTHTHWQRQK